MHHRGCLSERWGNKEIGGRNDTKQSVTASDGQSERPRPCTKYKNRKTSRVFLVASTGEFSAHCLPFALSAVAVMMLSIPRPSLAILLCLAVTLQVRNRGKEMAVGATSCERALPLVARTCRAKSRAYVFQLLLALRAREAGHDNALPATGEAPSRLPAPILPSITERRTILFRGRGNGIKLLEDVPWESQSVFCHNWQLARIAFFFPSESTRTTDHGSPFLAERELSASNPQLTPEATHSPRKLPKQ